MSRYRVKIGEKVVDVELLSKKGGRLSFRCGGSDYHIELQSLLKDGGESADPKGGAPAARKGDRGEIEIKAPLPGLITKILVKPGKTVKAGEHLLSIEAMKMENNISAPAGGKVKKVHIKAGQEVQNNQLLITLG